MTAITWAYYLGKTGPLDHKLAQKRLLDVWQKMRGKRNFRKQYNEVFEEQLVKGLIEEVINEETNEMSVLHFLPHQEVITTQKATKIRIVFDAFSHYKICPLLKEVLHQDSILPELYGMLLLSRMKPYVAIQMYKMHLANQNTWRWLRLCFHGARSRVTTTGR